MASEEVINCYSNEGKTKPREERLETGSGAKREESRERIPGKGIGQKSDLGR